MVPRPSVDVVVAAAPTVVLLLADPHGGAGAALTVVAFGCSLYAARSASRSAALPATVWPVVATLAVAALVRGPLGSHDLWSYAFDGRVASTYGGDPYTAVASSYPHDVVFPLVGWRNTPMVYGPVFAAIAASVARVAGDSLLMIRLGFQVVAAGSVAASLWIVARRGLVSTVVLFALQPFVWVSVVNGGHNDAIVALLLLLAVVAFGRDRIKGAATLLAAAALVKLTAGLVVVPLVVALAARRRWKDVAIVGSVPVVALLVAQTVFPGSLTNAVHATAERISMASVWRSVQLLLDADATSLTSLASLLTVGLILAISFRRRHDTDLALATGAAASAFGLGAAYTLPWYSMWGLPLLALSGDAGATALVAGRGSLMMSAYQLRGADGWDPFGRFVLTTVVPIALLVAFVGQVSMRPTHPAALALTKSDLVPGPSPRNEIRIRGRGPMS